ncbi:MAG: T9SS type A sorting domain-containing protein [candidate division WOR-3 bacterium]
MGIIAIIILNLYSSPSVIGGRQWDQKIHNINNIEFGVTNYGKIGVPCYWPKGSGQGYIFGSGIWVGAIDSITCDTMVTIGYGTHGGESEFVPGLYGQDPGAPYVIIYMYPDPWPAPLDSFPMAPQEPLSDQDSWCCYNDCDSTYHMPNDTKPIGIGVYQTVYVWSDSLLADMAFLKFEIKNVLHKPIKNLYFGYCADCDIGNEAGTNANDICYAIVGKWYVVNGESIWVDNLAFQWQYADEPGWSDVGAIGFDLLQTPFDLQWGQDKDNDGIVDQYERDSIYYWNNVPPSQWDVDNDGVPDWRDASENPQMGMTAYKRFTLETEPNKDDERYLTLAGYNFRTGQYDPYDTIIPQPDDQRWMIASGPFELMPESSVTVILGVMLTYWDRQHHTIPDTELVLLDHIMQTYYNLNWRLGIQETPTLSPEIHTLSIRPNPVNNQAIAKFSLKEPSYVTLRLYNPLGQLVKGIFEGNKLSGEYNIRIDANGLPSGTYLLVLKSKSGISSRIINVIKTR